jgi:hypothetical protein
VGSLFKPKVATQPAPPPPAEIVDYIDNVNKISQKVVMGPDGKRTLVSERLPLSAEEQALENQYKSLQAKGLEQYKALQETGWLDNNPDVKQGLEAYYTANKRGIDTGFADATANQEEALARFGQSDSTAAAQARTGLGRNYQDQLWQLDNSKFQMGEQIRSQKQADALTMFNLGAQRGDALTAQLSDAFGRASGNQQYLAGLDQQRNLSIYNANLNDQTMRTQSSAAGKKAIGDLIGAAIGAAGGKGSSPSAAGQFGRDGSTYYPNSNETIYWNKR